MGHVFVFSADDGSRGGDRRASANGGADPDQDRHLSVQPQRFPCRIGRQERGGQGEEDDIKGLTAHFEHVEEVHAETEQDDRNLQQGL